MAKKVTQDDILEFNTLYLELGTYAAVARKTGFSAGTVKRYIIENFAPPAPQQKWNGELRPVGSFSIEKYPLTESEKADLEELRKEISI